MGQNATANPAGKEGDLTAAAGLPGSLEKAEVAERAYGRSPDHARGYLDGLAYRMHGKRPSKYLIIGIDEYALGFRAGYYNP